MERMEEERKTRREEPAQAMTEAKEYKAHSKKLLEYQLSIGCTEE